MLIQVAIHLIAIVASKAWPILKFFSSFSVPQGRYWNFYFQEPITASCPVPDIVQIGIVSPIM